MLNYLSTQQALINTHSSLKLHVWNYVSIEDITQDWYNDFHGHSII